MIETKSEEHIHKKELINPLTMIFQEKNLEQQCVVLIQYDSNNINCWSTVQKKMLYITYIVIYSNRTLEIRQGEIRLLLKGLVIGKRKK